MYLAIAQCPLHYLQLPGLVGEVFERCFEPARSYNNTFAVRKSLKPKFAVIGAHAAIANAAERKSIVDKMHQGVIDHAATKRNSRNNVVLQLWVIRKEVEGQRM